MTLLRDDPASAQRPKRKNGLPAISCSLNGGSIKTVDVEHLRNYVQLSAAPSSAQDDS